MAKTIIYWQQLLREADITIQGGGQIWEPSSDGPLFVRLECWGENRQGVAASAATLHYHACKMED